MPYSHTPIPCLAPDACAWPHTFPCFTHFLAHLFPPHAHRLAELDDPGLLHILVKQAAVLALDRKDRERELVSTLLCTLSVKVWGGVGDSD